MERVVKETKTGKRNMGFAFHLHHDVLMEWCYDYQARVRDIIASKPAGQLELRLRLFKLIPLSKLPGKNSAAGVKANAARAEANAAWAEYNATRAEANAAWAEYAATRAEYDAAEAKYNAAEAKYNVAWAEYGVKYLTAFERLHAELCPNCPWDGKTIFPTPKTEEVES